MHLILGRASIGAIAVSLLWSTGAALAQSNIDTHKTNGNGTPGFITGDLGDVIPPADQGAALGAANSRSVVDDQQFVNDVTGFLQDFVSLNYQPAGNEAVVAQNVAIDGQGTAHVRFGQTINGIRVVGAQLVVHVKTATGSVYAVNGEFVHGTVLSSAPGLTAKAATAPALAELPGKNKTTQSSGSLVYLMDDETNNATLAWETQVAYTSNNTRYLDWIYADANTGRLLAKHAIIHPIRVLQTYDAEFGPNYQGKLVCTDDELCSDAHAQIAHDNARITYDYLADRFGRDSYDNQGIPIVSTVNFRSDENKPMNNAFFLPFSKQMVYGDGDGERFGPLGTATDVVAHELAHGLTNSESGLVYENESGALNEAWSDIFGAGAEAWRDGGVSDNTWKIGEDVYTPNQPGDALRYMNEPARGRSRDYYPDRYVGDLDHGGVHINSGIANLAYYLLAEGGRHPRNQTGVDVPGIGIEVAEQIFYRATTTYLTPQSNFEAARVATRQSALDLYDQATADAVDLAWCAVGVPGCPSGDPDPDEEVCQGFVDTQNDISKSFWGSWRDSVQVPDCATELTVTISGGKGNADLYVSDSGRATKSRYTCKRTGSGNNHSCTLNNSSGKFVTILVSAKGFSFSGVNYRLAYR